MEEDMEMACLYNLSLLHQEDKPPKDRGVCLERHPCGAEEAEEWPDA